jgi:DNA repair exonuclease SbcCD nuclease subunit
MKFIHSADWQIGKVFKQFGAKEEALRQARLTAIENLGVLAKAHGVRHVLVAGDVYDSEAPSPVTLREPVERMRGFRDVHWHLLPGNHDPHRAEGVWDRVAELRLPENILLHLTPQPVPLDDGAACLLPAPLLRKGEFNDVTAWMDSAETPAGALRIGLAHGSVVNFGNEGEANNPIDPTRPERARLDYLALGDWHRTLQVGPRAWYAGTHEPDRAGRQERGTALLVDVSSSEAAPTVEHLVTGTYRWATINERLGDANEFGDFDKRLRDNDDLSRVIMRLRIEGALSVAAYAELQDRLVDLSAAMFHLDADLTKVVARPTRADLEAIDFDGVLRRTADRLQTVVNNGEEPVDFRRRAEEALIELYVRVTGSQAGKAA